MSLLAAIVAFYHDLTVTIVATKVSSEEERDKVKVAGPAGGPDTPLESVSESSASEATKTRRAIKFNAKGKVIRSTFYTEKRQELDRHRCVITGTRDPEVCHIIPFTANSTEEVRKSWQTCVRVATWARLIEMEPGQDNWDLETRLCSLFAHHPGVSDKHWNTISLAPNLHDWWGKGYFGLKCLGLRPGDGDVPDHHPNQILVLRIQFHWMIWREREIGQKMAPLGRTMESMKAAFPQYAGRTAYCGDYSPSDGRPIVAISRPATGINLETGDIFEIRVPRRHAQKMMAALNLQWALNKVLAMAGGAEALDNIPDHPEFLDENWCFPGKAASRRMWFELNTAMMEEEEEEEERERERGVESDSPDPGSVSEEDLGATGDGEPSQEYKDSE